MGDSVAFDRAAEVYDATRAISEEAMARTIELLTGEVAGRGRVLEVGVGTGLLALRLHEAGLNLAGLDISAPMVSQLVQKAGGTVPFPLVIGDATGMPFADASFGGAYLRWVLHLVPDWRGLIAEVARVVRPGGEFLASLGTCGGPRQEIRERFGELLGVSLDPVGLGWDDFASLDRAMAELGTTARELPPIHEGSDESLGEYLVQIERGLWSWTWDLPEADRLRAVAELRPWAEERFGPLDEGRPFEYATRWRAYDPA